MSLDANMGRVVRRYLAGLDRDAGAVVPETDGNQAVPRASTANAEVSRTLLHARSDTHADRDDTGPAHRGSPNDFAWRRQERPSMGGYREEVVFEPASTDGAVVTIDPNRAATWWVDCAGSVTIQLADAEPVDGLDEYVDAPTQAELVTIWIVRNKGKSITWPAKWMWDIGVRGGSIGSDNPFAGASQDAQIDAYTVTRIPNRGIFAFVSGRKFA